MLSAARHALVATALAALSLAAQGPAPQDSAARSAAEFEASLRYQTGVISLTKGLATLTLPSGYRYLDSEDTERVLVAWGNPPGSETLGMILPAGKAVTDSGSWAVIVSYDEDGHVKDDEAASIKYDELLRDMQKGTRDANKERTKEGYPPVALVGWAARPHYDSASHKLYWAKELQFGDEAEHTLNYDVRALGRRGVLVLSAVASMGQLADVEAGMQEVLGFVSFNEGHRYADFLPSTDKVAAYGIGALIAGKVAVKVGLFKMLIGILIASKKLVVVGVVAVGAFLQRVFRGRKATESVGKA
jgi:uncharacterized membrane-anchored protein